MSSGSNNTMMKSMVLTISFIVSPICPSYAPNTNSQYVLETVSGFAQRHNIGLGTYIKFDLMG